MDGSIIAATHPTLVAIPVRSGPNLSFHISHIAMSSCITSSHVAGVTGSRCGLRRISDKWLVVRSIEGHGLGRSPEVSHRVGATSSLRLRRTHEIRQATVFHGIGAPLRPIRVQHGTVALTPGFTQIPKLCVGPELGDPRIDLVNDEFGCNDAWVCCIAPRPGCTVGHYFSEGEFQSKWEELERRTVPAHTPDGSHIAQIPIRTYNVPHVVHR